MAYKSGLLLSMLLIATFSSVANSLLVLNDGTQTASGLTVVGTLVNTILPSNCVGGVTVTLLNIVTNEVLCSAVSDPLGNFKLVYVPQGTLVFVQVNFVVSVDTSNIAGFNQVGLLQAPLGQCNLITDLLLSLLGLIAKFPCGSFIFKSL